MPITARRPGEDLARFSDRIRVLRALAGWTQAELAAAAGEPPAAIKRWEATERSPRLESILGLSMALGLPETVVMGRDPIPGVEGTDTEVEVALWKDSTRGGHKRQELAQKVWRTAEWQDGVLPVQGCALAKQEPGRSCAPCPLASSCQIGAAADRLLTLKAKRGATDTPSAPAPVVASPTVALAAPVIRRPGRPNPKKA